MSPDKFPCRFPNRSFLGSTLYCAQLKRDPHFQGPPLLASEALHAIARLKGQRLAQWDGSEWRGSGLGKAISVSERAVASGARTLHELEEVRQKGICLVNDVHVIYLCVPLDNVHRYLGEWPVDWPWLQGMLASKSTESQQIKALCEGLLGLEMGLLDPLAAGMTGLKTLDEARQRFGRLWLATMLFLALNNRHEQMNPFWKHSKHGATFAENRARMIVCRGAARTPDPQTEGQPCHTRLRTPTVGAGVPRRLLAARLGADALLPRDGGDLDPISLRSRPHLAPSSRTSRPDLAPLAPECIPDLAPTSPQAADETWWQLRAIFEVARERLWWCVSADVLPLLSDELPSITAVYAVALYAADRPSRLHRC